MLICLNRTGINGLFRLNLTGALTVPLGRFVNPRVCDAANFRRVARALANDGVTVQDDRFETVCNWAKSGGFLYFDPPYAPASATSSFTGYMPGGFSSDDQQRLQRVVIELARGGFRVLLSNVAAPKSARSMSTTCWPDRLVCGRIASRPVVRSTPRLRLEVQSTSI